MAFNRNKSLTKAQKLLQKGKNAEAIKEYQEVVDNDPADVRTLLKIGDLQAKIGSIESANDTYHKVADHYAKDGFFLKAVAVFKQILKLDPGLIAVYLRLAELYQQLGLNSEALKQYQVVVKHYESQGLKKESLDILRKMAELDPENTASKVKLAELYAKEGHREAATEQLRSIAADLKKKENWQELGRVYEKMEAVGIADTAMKVELSEVYLKTADPRKALTRLQELFAAEPKNTQILELLARTFVDLQQAEKAKSVYSELVALFEETRNGSEKDRIVAKMRTLGLELTATPTVSGVPAATPTVATPKAAPAKAVATPAPIPEAGPPSTEEALAKTLQEIEVFLKYGLIDKACQTLSKAAMANPEHLEIRQKLMAAFKEKGDLVALAQILNAVCSEAQSRNLGEVVEAAIRAEVLSISGPEGGAAEEILDVDADMIVDDAATAAPFEAAPVEASLPPIIATEPESEILAEEEISFEIVDDEAPAIEVASPLIALDAVEAVETVEEIEIVETLEAPEAQREESLDAEFERVEAPADLEIPITLEADSSEIQADLGLDMELGADFDLPSEPEPAEALPLVSSIPIPSLEEEMVVLSDESEGEVEVEAVEEAAVELAAEGEEELSVEAEAEEPVEVASEAEEEELVVAAEYDESDPFSMEMEEADYFVSKGLLDEASEVYESILAQDADYEPAKAKLEEIRAARPKPSAISRSKGTPERRLEVRAKKAEILEESLEDERPAATKRILEEKRTLSGGEGFFDLTSELQDEIQELETSLIKAKDQDKEEFLSPEEVISEFKKGVARTVARDDHQTHYNLGIAYKEMGLLNEAITEFEIASEGPKMAIDAASMIGLCLCGKREFVAAIDVYRKALARTSPDTLEALGLSYELAEAYIGNGKLADAYKLFARICDVDVTFRDARRRAKELEADLGAAAPHPSAPERRTAKKEVAVEIPGKKNKISYI